MTGEKLTKAMRNLLFDLDRRGYAELPYGERGTAHALAAKDLIRHDEPYPELPTFGAWITADGRAALAAAEEGR